jgi:hypothetical protein
VSFCFSQIPLRVAISLTRRTTGPFARRALIFSRGNPHMPIAVVRGDCGNVFTGQGDACPHGPPSILDIIAPLLAGFLHAQW